jgi:deazaflavin-dependent oxidoreductase (nitroreductase family)
MDRFSMTPMLRLGLGPLIGNPVTGYMMVLETLGRKTGQPRYTPMNYAILDGSIYCIARWGSAADWLRNLRANPNVEALLPGRAIVGVAEQVTDLDEALRALRQVLVNGGITGLSQGVNPATAPDEVLRAHTPGMLVVRIRPIGAAVESGPADPGGWAWLLVWLGALLLIVAWIRRRLLVNEI